MTSNRVLAAIGALFLVAAGACGAGNNDGGGLAGVWERTDRRDVIEFRDDGTYALHESASGESGPYTVSGSTLTLEGGRYAAGGWTHAFVIKKGELTLTNSWRRDAGSSPVVDETHWRRADAHSLTPLVNVGGDLLPSNLPALARAALAYGRLYNDEYELARIDLAESMPGVRPVTFYLTAPNQSGMSIQLRPFHVRINRFDKILWGVRPLPVHFMDLPKAAQAAHMQNFTEKLTRAELVSLSPRRAVWRLYSIAGSITLDAVTGDVVPSRAPDDGAPYDADWKKTVAALDNAYKRAKPSKACAPYEVEFESFCTPKPAWLECRAADHTYSECLDAKM